VAEDKNQTVKKQLLKKREEATRRKVPLAPGEMVDDALARGMASTGRWLKANFGALQWVFIAAIVAGAAYAAYDRHSIKRTEAASNELIKAAVAEHGRIAGASAPKPEEGAPDDPTPVFKSADERADTALASYRKVTSSYPGSGAAILARLGEAGVLLDKRNWDGALAAYRDVKGSPLAKADVTVRAAALEGIGLALEAKGDADEALKTFRELENTDLAGQKELGMYHQARILVAKGDLDKAKELLKTARDRVKSHDTPATTPGGGEMRPFNFLESQIEDLLRRVDPGAIAAEPKMTPEQVRRFQEQLRRMNEHGQAPAPGPAPAGSH
jgi:predicted negative regulator of RcsB-dependent stress response